MKIVLCYSRASGFQKFLSTHLKIKKNSELHSRGTKDSIEFSYFFKFFGSDILSPSVQEILHPHLNRAFQIQHKSDLQSSQPISEKKHLQNQPIIDLRRGQNVWHPKKTFHAVIGVIQDNIAVGFRVSCRIHLMKPIPMPLGPGWISPPKVDSWMVYNQ